uniref:Polyprotein P3 n=1 Tax=Cacopsylla melanoneura TaxID=428564 RepID=A0A8D9BRF4_9HEMI
MSIVISEMLKKGIVTETRETSGFISHMFLRLKANGKPRPIFNLSHLNTFLALKRFRLINHFKLPKFLMPGDFMVTVDLSDAYCHVPIKQSHQRFLAFRYMGTTYNWTCLPFGLASAPQAFAQLSNWVAQLLRSWGVRVVVYLDDFLIAARSPLQLEEDTKLTLNLLRHLGWVVNMQKSQLNPSQSRSFLGLDWDTRTETVSLPDQKARDIRHHIGQFLSKGKWSLKAHRQLLGILSFAAFAVPLGRLHLRPLQIAGRSLPRGNPRENRTIPPPCLTALTWWSRHLKDGSPYTPPPRSVVISTDASDWGLGVHIGSHLYLRHEWSEQQQTWHINHKELYAIRWAIESNLQLFRNKSITVLTDSTTVAGQIRKEGGLRSKTLLLETDKLLRLVYSLQSVLKPPLTEDIQHTGRQALSEPSSPRVAPDGRGNFSYLQEMGNARSRLICLSQIGGGPKLCDTRPVRSSSVLFTNAFSRPWVFNLAWIFPPSPHGPETPGTSIGPVQYNQVQLI